MKNLVIVESPAKAKTIEKYLRDIGDFTVVASFGHVRDLIKKNGAVDPDNHFEMKYALIDRNKKHFDQIAKLAKESDAIWLATDPDREGEAIAWHIVEELKAKKGLKDKPVHRISFNQITKNAVTSALEASRELAMDLVNAQQTRRGLDYLVGFNLSPLLWRKVHPGLSAGRVQSPALRLICERELEREAFVSQEFWTIDALLALDKATFPGKCVEIDGTPLEKFTLTKQDQVDPVLEAIKKAGDLTVRSVESKERKRHPAPPFITSTLQQEASRKLGFSAAKTMMVAQQLYEGVDIGGHHVGLITYMRTDSTHLAPEALSALRETIQKTYGDNYLPKSVRTYKAKAKNAQEAHEAIRPTHFEFEPNKVASALTSDQHKLYQLVWRRCLASQMTEALFNQTAVESENSKAAFRSTGQVLLFDGFLKVYQESVDDAETDEKHVALPPISKGQTLSLAELNGNQHFTEPPPRYTEATLVKTLEGYGIGRPSTYAPIISTLLQRNYVELRQKRFHPTDTGRQVNKLLSEHFTRYVDYDFTASLEDELDAISRGEKDYLKVLENYWGPFIKLVDEKNEHLKKSDISDKRLLGDDPKTGLPIYTGLGRYGSYVQLGDYSEDDQGPKPRYASLRGDQSIYSITLEEALPLFDLPRDLGKDEDGNAISANLGRYGHYVRSGNTFASIKDGDAFSVTLEEAITLLKEKKEAAKKKVILEFDGGISVLKGRYGPYITNGKVNARIPKGTEPESLSREECEKLVEEAATKKKRK